MLDNHVDTDGFSVRLNELKERMHLSGNQLAALMGQNASKVAGYLRGANLPRIDFLMTINFYYPLVNIDYLITGRGKLLLDKEEPWLKSVEVENLESVSSELDKPTEEYKKLYETCREQLKDKDKIISLYEKQLGL